MHGLWRLLRGSHGEQRMGWGEPWGFPPCPEVLPGVPSPDVLLPAPGPGGADFVSGSGCPGKPRVVPGTLFSGWGSPVPGWGTPFPGWAVPSTPPRAPPRVGAFPLGPTRPAPLRSNEIKRNQRKSNEFRAAPYCSSPRHGWSNTPPVTEPPGNGGCPRSTPARPATPSPPGVPTPNESASAESPRQGKRREPGTPKPSPVLGPCHWDLLWHSLILGSILGIPLLGSPPLAPLLLECCPWDLLCYPCSWDPAPSTVSPYALISGIPPPTPSLCSQLLLVPTPGILFLGFLPPDPCSWDPLGTAVWWSWQRPEPRDP